MCIVKLQTSFVCSRFKKIWNFVHKKCIMIRFTLCGFSHINILSMVYIMYFILFQCIRIIKSENNYDFYDFFLIVNFTFSA